MKIKLIIISFPILLLSSCTQKFEHLSERNSETEALLKKIQPNSMVKYWQLEYFPNYKTETIDTEILFSKGNHPNPIPINKIDISGFFSGCQPAYCSYKIFYLENETWKLANSEDELKRFIGQIDNVYEAYLIGRINGYRIDANSEKGNGFIKKKDGFKLNMMKYESCPESKESFTFFVNKSGVIEDLKSNGFYLKTKDCIVY
jgi:hypothetical protein